MKNFLKNKKWFAFTLVEISLFIIVANALFFAFLNNLKNSQECFEQYSENKKIDIFIWLNESCFSVYSKEEEKVKNKKILEDNDLMNFSKKFIENWDKDNVQEIVKLEYRYYKWLLEGHEKVNLQNRKKSLNLEEKSELINEIEDLKKEIEELKKQK